MGLPHRRFFITERETMGLRNRISTNADFMDKSMRELIDAAKNGILPTLEEWIEQRGKIPPEKKRLMEEMYRRHKKMVEDRDYQEYIKREEFARRYKKKDKVTTNGFHTRFQQLDENTIQETNEVGSVRLFHLNKETGIWEAKDALSQKTELTIVGKDLFAVKETYQGSFETILYSPARKIQEMFVRGKNGKYSLMERTDENIDGTRDRQIFDESGKMVEQRVSENWALKKLVRDGKVLFDNTKSTQQKLNNAIKINNGLKR